MTESPVLKCNPNTHLTFSFAVVTAREYTAWELLPAHCITLHGSINSSFPSDNEFKFHVLSQLIGELQYLSLYQIHMAFPLKYLKAEVEKEQCFSATSGETEALGVHTIRGGQCKV